MRDPGDRITIHWENIFSLRYWGGALLAGIGFVIVGALLGFVQSVTTVMFWFGVVLALIGGLIGRRYWCPYCRGTVRGGATVCRHCGREFTV